MIFLKAFNLKSAFSAPARRRGGSPKFAQHKTCRQELSRSQSVRVEARRRDQNQFVFRERLGANTSLASGPFNQAESHSSFEQPAYDFAGIPALQRELDFRVLVLEGSEQTWKYVLRDCRGGTQRQFTRDTALAAAEFLFRFRGKSRQLVCYSSNSEPWWVSVILPPVRSKTRTPRSLSSALTCKVTAGWVRKSRSAALRKFRCSATARNTLRRKFSKCAMARLCRIVDDYSALTTGRTARATNDTLVRRVRGTVPITFKVHRRLRPMKPPFAAQSSANPPPPRGRSMKL